MPLYDYQCEKCGKTEEVLALSTDVAPPCCGDTMTRLYTAGDMRVRVGYPIWINRMEEIHKRQADKGQRLSNIHPREVRAT
jgi:putative FmdB family regulatory protein